LASVCSKSSCAIIVILIVPYWPIGVVASKRAKVGRGTLLALLALQSQSQSKSKSSGRRRKGHRRSRRQSHRQRHQADDGVADLLKPSPLASPQRRASAQGDGTRFVL